MVSTCPGPTRGWNRPSLRLGGKAHGVFDGACCILNLNEHSRLGGSTAGRWAFNKDLILRGGFVDEV